MNEIRSFVAWTTAVMTLTGFLFAGCSGAEGTVPTPNVPSPDTATTPPPKSGIAVPPAVRENLGIRFVEVETRAIANTRRTPGVFELLPNARHEYRAPVRGRVFPKVDLFQQVEAGELLFTINSPQWRQVQHEAVEAEGEITMAEAQRDVVRARLAEARAVLAKVEERLKNLTAAGTRNAELEAEATSLRGSLPRLQAESRAQDAAVEEAHEHYASRLRTLASVTGRSEEELTRESNGSPAWRKITELEVRAEAAGSVQALDASQGSWLEEGELALTTIAPEQIQFHAEAPQSDIAIYENGQPARIVPPQGSSLDVQNAGRGSLQLGLVAKEDEGTISVFVRPQTVSSWTRAGVSAFLEVNTSGDAREYWAVPRSAVIQDGLEHVYYRRDPDDPDRVLRVLADLGESDGRWVALRSGVKAGDEVVLDGAYALKLTDAGQQAPEGYHYHADGSLHTNH